LLENTQWLGEREIRKVQLARLRRVLGHAYSTVPYYRAVFRQIGLRPEDVKDVSDLGKIPLLTRDILRSRNEELVSTTSQRASREHTGGTTSTPVSFLRDKCDGSWGWAAALRAYSWAGYETGDKEALVWASSSIKPHPLGPLYDKAKRTLLIDITSFSTQKMNHILRELEKFRPDFIRGYSKAVRVLADNSLEGGRDLEARGVISTANMLYELHRKVISRAFRCPVFDFYGSREVMTIAAECEEHEGLHVTAENMVLEVVRDGESASPGEVGSLVVTNLTNYSMPLIRYEIGDLGRFASSLCSCGRGLPLLESLEGREYEYIVNSDGSYTYLRDLETFFGELPVKDFQVVLEGPDLITVNIVEGEAYSEEHDRFIKANLKWSGRSKVEIRRVTEIGDAPSGKRLRILRQPS
ncbi:MAG: phenylacetate--CoA ligase family protein, partial [Thermoplasmata archaeon]